MSNTKRGLDSHLHSPYKDREWLVTNGLGGYSSASLDGGLTRKYHGLLIAALPAPLGRTVMLNFVQDSIRINANEMIYLSKQEIENGPFLPEPESVDFHLEDGLPVWTYHVKGILLEKRIFMTHWQNTVHISYTLKNSTAPVELFFQPFFQFRHHEESVQNSITDQYDFIARDNQYEIAIPNLASLHLIPNKKAKFVYEKKEFKNVKYYIEEERGYDAIGKLTSPGYFVAQMQPNEQIDFIASIEDWDFLKNISSKEALKIELERRDTLIGKAQQNNPHIVLNDFAKELVLASDQFVIMPFSRLSDIAWTHAIGEEARSIIAGYHWFTDWGRDTMISLEGLLLVTGRIVEAKYTLLTFIHHLRNGLIPNMFPDKEGIGRYNTVDATLWFFHALDRYVAYSQDKEFVKMLLPKIKEIIECHINGTDFGIHMDKDGLLTQGREGFALTWMDAKVGNLVVTPRRGKTVEVNALWYNALCLAQEWFSAFGEPEEAAKVEKIANRCYASFNEKFWNSELGYLYDIVDGEGGNDPACRPNQIFAISLRYPVLKKEYWQTVMDLVQKRLLTSLGLRTLSSEHRDYKVSYHGNLFLRDMAYHQGTVWAWLLGPFIDAWLKVYPDRRKEANQFLEIFEIHLNDSGVGSINEIFDAESPFLHRGCIAQAWSVAEVLRSWVKINQGN